MLKRKDGIKREDFESEWGVPTNTHPRTLAEDCRLTTCAHAQPTVCGAAVRGWVHVATDNGCSVTAISVVMEDIHSHSCPLLSE